MSAGAWPVQFVVFFSIAVLFRDENRLHENEVFQSIICDFFFRWAWRCSFKAEHNKQYNLCRIYCEYHMFCWCQPSSGQLHTV